MRRGKELASNPLITFCILTFEKTAWLKNTLLSIRQYCGVDYSVKILSQGKPDAELARFMADSKDDDVEVLTSEVNLGCDGGRKFLANEVETPLAMMIDDDMYLTERAIESGLNVLRANPQVGAVSMPQYDPRGWMISAGGQKLIIRNGVINVRRPLLDDSAWIEIQHIDGGAMIFRIQMRDCFTWDDRSGFLQDLDKSLQILRSGRWKQAIAPSGKLIHDRSWVGKKPKYEQTRFNGLTLHNNYEYFRKKWGLRLDLRTHLLYEVLYPGLALTHCPITVSQIDRFIRTSRKRLPL
ncbi:MAG TPA: glycosyltransferase [Candidatus Acidoferrum sp.]|nr:glycosyltransferase [Candidatus Acidoferrum sp.]